MPSKKSKGSPSSDLRVKAAEAWGKEHKQTIHQAFQDIRFRSAFNRYRNNPNFKTRRDVGLRPKAAKHERLELQLISQLKAFGDS